MPLFLTGILALEGTLFNTAAVSEQSQTRDSLQYFILGAFSPLFDRTVKSEQELSGRKT